MLPDTFEDPPDKTADVLLDFFGQGQAGQSGGAIEPAADDDGVLIDHEVEAAQVEPAGAA